ncbi:amino acid permease-domain-containing protein [Aspergillus stella-maris]|uniref:amino acid permease-domain-containing protein n=1 Tax=Aspergillus stella-maris TaxID=1810926 RepID=UPI003CCE48F2
MGWMSILAASFDCMATWNTFPSTLLISFVYGGPAATAWGIVVVGLIYIPIAITLCELVSAYPSVGGGGLYHWAGILAPAKYRRSYACGSLSWFSWVALTASGAGALGNFAQALIAWYDAAYVCSNFFSFLVNAYARSALSKIYKARFVFSLFACTTIFITILVGQKEKQTSSFVWTTLANNTGWPDGVAFLITLSGPTVMYCPIDGIVHLVEDTKGPRVTVPRAILMALALSFVSATAFGIATTYCISDFQTALDSRTGTLTTTQIVSRMTWSFANDHALPFSHYLSGVSEKRKVPLRALCFNAVLIFAIGCLYLISSTAFIAILNISVVFQQITLAFPSALLLYQRRNPQYLPRDAPFRVPNTLGWFCNIVAVVYAVIALVFFQFPWSDTVQFSTTMNFTVIVFGSFLVASTNSWFVFARKRYTPPALVFAD